jgi:FlaA1/EpsC-like NDP-sugar epimerase
MGSAAPVQPAILVMDWAGVLLLVCGCRAAARFVHEVGRSWFPRTDRPLQRVLVVGAGESGAALVRRIGVTSRLGMQAVGFLDDDPQTHGRTLAGLPDLGAPCDVKRIARRQRVSTLLVQGSVLPAQSLRALVGECHAAGV